MHLGWIPSWFCYQYWSIVWRVSACGEEPAAFEELLVVSSALLVFARWISAVGKERVLEACILLVQCGHVLASSFQTTGCLSSEESKMWMQSTPFRWGIFWYVLGSLPHFVPALMNQMRTRLPPIAHQDDPSSPIVFIPSPASTDAPDAPEEDATAAELPALPHFF